jgi:hypothetical protein
MRCPRGRSANLGGRKYALSNAAKQALIEGSPAGATAQDRSAIRHVYAAMLSTMIKRGYNGLLDFVVADLMAASILHQATTAFQSQPDRRFQNASREA